MFEQLKALLVASFRVAPADVTPDQTLRDLDLDSLDLAELSLAIEQGLGAPVSDDELAELQQLGQIARLIEERGATVR